MDNHKNTDKGNTEISTDNLYALPRTQLNPFVFDKDVALVFDNMIERSIPNYLEIQKSISGLAKIFAKPQTSIWDLGCSTGTTLMLLYESLQGIPLTLYGVDNSAAMIAQCENKLHSRGLEISTDKSKTVTEDCTSLHLLCSDISDLTITNASVVILNYTLQFIPPAIRQGTLNKIVAGLVKGGLLIMSEKVSHSNPTLDAIICSLHHCFKQNQGYSKLEIAQKREALENVLIPATIEENLTMLKESGLTEPQIFFKELNFATFLGIKST